MFPNRLIILCFIYFVHAYDRDYVAELDAEGANGDVFILFGSHL